MAAGKALRRKVSREAQGTFHKNPHRTDPIEILEALSPKAQRGARRAARYAWAMLLARIYEVFPLLCPRCGAEMRIIAFIIDRAIVRDILAHLGKPSAPPPIAPARGPPLWDLTDARTGDFDPHAQPPPEYAFDQRIAW